MALRTAWDGNYFFRHINALTIQKTKSYPQQIQYQDLINQDE